MIARLIAGLLIAGAALTAVPAPTAAAQNPYCEQTGLTPCQQPGHSWMPTGTGEPMQSNNGYGWFVGAPPISPAFIAN